MIDSCNFFQCSLDVSFLKKWLSLVKNKLYSRTLHEASKWKRSNHSFPTHWAKVGNRRTSLFHFLHKKLLSHIEWTKLGRKIFWNGTTKKRRLLAGPTAFAHIWKSIVLKTSSCSRKSALDSPENAWISSKWTPSEWRQHSAHLRQNSTVATSSRNWIKSFQKCVIGAPPRHYDSNLQKSPLPGWNGNHYNEDITLRMLKILIGNQWLLDTVWMENTWQESSNSKVTKGHCQFLANCMHYIEAVFSTPAAPAIPIKPTSSTQSRKEKLGRKFDWRKKNASEKYGSRASNWRSNMNANWSGIESWTRKWIDSSTNGKARRNIKSQFFRHVKVILCHTFENWKFIFMFTAYAGGRTECSTLYCQLSEEDQKAGWSMEYLDVTSLYPYVLSDPAFEYPNGHPRYIKENFPRNNEELLKITGLVKAEILPPRDLFWPILWMRSNDSGTLVFPLCRTCAQGTYLIKKKMCSLKAHLCFFSWRPQSGELHSLYRRAKTDGLLDNARSASGYSKWLSNSKVPWNMGLWWCWTEPVSRLSTGTETSQIHQLWLPGQHSWRWSSKMAGQDDSARGGVCVSVYLFW